MAAPLADFTYFNNRNVGGITDPNDPRLLQALAAVRQYDPNASLRATQLGGEGGSGATTYTLDYDASKLPGTNGSGSLGGPTGGSTSFVPDFSTVQPHMNLTDPNAVTDSPTYGRITANTNIYDKFDPMSVLGPLAVLGFGLAAPSLFGAYSTLDGAAGAAGNAAAGSAGGAAQGGDLAGGLGGGAADELANGGQYIAGAAAGDPTSIAVSNFLATHGIPTQFGLSSGALGAAASEPGFGLGSLGNLASAASKVPGLLSGATGGAGGGGMGGGGLLSAGGGPGATQDALSVLRAFYGDPESRSAMDLARQRKGLF